MHRLAEWLFQRAYQHPYFHIYGESAAGVHQSPYMRRWWLLGHGTHRDRIPANVGAGDFQNQRNRKAGWLHNWIAQRLVIRVHQILRSDRGRDLHDHPAWNISIVLEGGYWELVPAEHEGSNYPFRMPYTQEPALYHICTREPCIALWRKPGAWVFRRARTRHQIILREGESSYSLFIVGRKSNEWGFYTAAGKVPHWRYTELVK